MSALRWYETAHIGYEWTDIDPMRALMRYVPVVIGSMCLPIEPMTTPMRYKCVVSYPRSRLIGYVRVLIEPIGALIEPI
jgi:hypothetical protein